MLPFHFLFQSVTPCNINAHNFPFILCPLSSVFRQFNKITDNEMFLVSCVSSNPTHKGAFLKARSRHNFIVLDQVEEQAIADLEEPGN
jgi:hypothetical protein